jgi:hypothetical protein
MRYLCFDSALNEVYTLLLLQQEYPVYRSLFKDTTDEDLWEVAPWLFQIEHDFIFKKNDDPNFSLKRCLIIETPVSIKELTIHLQQFLYVTVNGKKQFNRFWDAAVLTQQLPKMNSSQLTAFFEEIVSVYAQQENEWLQFSLNKKDKLFSQPIATNTLFNRETTKENTEPASNSPTDQQPKRRRFFTE